jgi:hypothetical protein
MNRSGEMKQNQLIAVGTLAVLVITIVSMAGYNLYYIVDTKSLKMQYEVTEKMGFNLETEYLNLGKNYPGGGSRRDVSLANHHEFPVKVSIKINGNITPLVSLSENNFILEPSEEKKVTYYVSTERDAMEGVYTGNTVILFTRLLYS